MRYIILLVSLQSVLVLSCASMPDRKGAESWNDLGLEYKESGKYDEAEEAFLEAIRLDPGLAEAYNNLGRVYFVTGRYDKAVESFSRAAGLEPEGEGIYINLGSSYARLGRLSEAADALSKAISIRPDNPQAHRDLGVVRLMQNDRAGALEQYEALRLLDPRAAEDLLRTIHK